MMRTNIVLDDDLFKEAMKYVLVRTKLELVRRALQEFIANNRRRDLRKIRGKVRFAEGYDYKSLRAGRDKP